MSVMIASDVLQGIVEAAQQSPEREVCGLLLGTSAGQAAQAVSGVLACANVAADPDRRFEIEPAALLAAHRASRNGSPAVIGHYHSHPSGDPLPSPRDAADAAADGSLWLIVAGGEVRGWRAVGNGALHGRFDPVGLHVVTPPATTDRT